MRTADTETGEEADEEEEEEKGEGAGEEEEETEKSGKERKQQAKRLHHLDWDSMRRDAAIKKRYSGAWLKFVSLGLSKDMLKQVKGEKGVEGTEERTEERRGERGEKGGDRINRYSLDIVTNGDDLTATHERFHDDGFS